MRYWVIFILMFFLSFSVSAAVVTSPNGKVAVTLEMKKNLETDPSADRFCFSVSYDGKAVLLDSPLRLDFKGMPAMGENLAVVGESRQSVNEVWRPLWGKSSRVVNAYNELTLTLQETQAPHRIMTVTARAYDDGVGLRYGFPAECGFTDFKLAAERTEFHFPGNPTVWAVHFEHFQTHQEGEYPRKLLGDLHPGDLIGCPLLVQLPHAWAALTEADLDDWAGIYFTRSTTAANAVVSVLSPRLDEKEVAVISRAPRLSPWRVLLIGEKPGDLIESNLILNLNPPCEIKDTSWIRPGISAWDRWWCGSYAPDYPGKLGVDTPSMKYFIDFAAEMGWEYQLVDWFWYGNPFDPSKPFGTAGNPAVSILKSTPEIDIPELVRYGAKKGVKILVWLDWFNADREMEKAFPLYEKWGVAGVKVDFMARDDQEMVNFYRRLVKLAAKHHLVVDFHGAYKPDGFQRTYPNLLTREGVLGNEYNKWSRRITPTHNVTLPFTRMLCGPMDYTPGGFRNKTPQTFRPVGGDDPGPFVMTTRAQQLAMFVVYESPLQVACDSPYNYRVSPAGLDFLKIVPTTWDETKVLDGYPGEFVVIARRSGKTWFVGAMTNEQPRIVSLPLAFLGKGRFKATIWADPDEAADYPDRLQKQEIKLSGDKLELHLAGSGGAVVVIKPIRK
ncbi:MAG: glycoside hydrolase family 97 protein [candidate division KSB1 bacterium]|nr:glycoside hydrolase family 97 protein [candidate division KSB1 bacterium]